MKNLDPWVDPHYGSVGYTTKSTRKIEQSPLDCSPDVPRGTLGFVEDWSDGLFAVDFGGIYGVVFCYPDEISNPVKVTAM